jgi:hypothetical protein
MAKGNAGIAAAAKGSQSKGPRRDARKERRWRTLIDEHRRSGQSVRAFCRQQKIYESSFYHWRRELSLRDREAASDDAKQPMGTSVPRSKTRPTLAPVVVIEELGAPAAPIEIVRTDGVTIRVPAGATREQLAMVLDALEHGPC